MREALRELRDEAVVAICLFTAALILLPLLFPRILFAAGLSRPAMALTAFAEVGPAAGVCLSPGTPYEYAPAATWWHWGLLRDPPEAAVAAHFRDAVSPFGASAADIVVERVKIDIHSPSGPTEVLAKVRWSDGREERYTVRLHSGAGSSWVSLDSPTAEVMLCSKGFGRWKVDEVSSA